MTRLGSSLRSPVNDARLARVWSKVDQRLTRAERQRPWRIAGLSAVSCAALALLMYVASERGAAPILAGAPPQVVQLADGSRIEHAGQARVQIQAVTPERIELRMTEGRALFRVAKNKKRAFLTHARGYTIRVVGTQYAVDLNLRGVEVDVSEGEVEVRRDGSKQLWRVRAGQRWSSTNIAQSSPPPPPPAPAVAQKPLAPEPAPTLALPEPAPEPTSAPAIRERPVAAAPRVAPAPRTAPVKADVASDAATLFQRAQDARATGQRALTEQLLTEFLRRFPADSRVEFAAFELGRLRLEAGDAQGAREALDRAGDAGVRFREQVQARRVQALEAAGELEACRTARAEFLEKYPYGTFAEIVRRRCP